MKTLIKIKMTVIAFVTVINATSKAEEFCATNSNELVAALSAAATNNQSDIIKIESGSYIAPTGGFRYLSNQGDDIQISGGYLNAGSIPCGDVSAPTETYLDGNFSNPAMRIQNTNLLGDSHIKVSGISFINGGKTVADVGGLFISARFLSSDAKITLENNAFINNTADFVAGLDITSSVGRIEIKNNLFTLNRSLNNQDEFNPTVYISDMPNVGQKLYFTNNTVVNNVGAGVHIFQNQGNASNTLIANNIFWHNDVTDLHLTDNGFNFLHHNNIGIYSGDAADNELNNISEEPIFESGAMNFTPVAYSSLVSGGVRPPVLSPIPIPFEHDWSIGITDFEGNERLQGVEIDIGAIESPHINQQSEPPIFKNGFEIIEE
ncbi:hypothetical protein [Marinicella sp. W31]|uniref:hypothetical protein n=1 Tax=Marinicella sp. W31 TaxID=3023713 RepID=UPI0037563236